ncbi:MAG: pyridoxamine 5'-phosphate oxidase, partial [Eudoraea sp.]|nr:pyridoxamine 5'-phosphate oxidase [Eudoraea sp.]
MEKNLENIRKAYGRSDLNEANLPVDPITLFKKWFHELEASGSTDEPNA